MPLDTIPGTIARRTLIGSALGLASAPAVALARAGPFRIGLLSSGRALKPSDNPWMQAFVERLGQLGYSNGKNVTFEIREALGDEKRFAELTAESIAARPDVIFVTATPPLLALFRQHSGIPVVFVIGFDPVKLGIAKTLARPDGDFTGLYNDATDVTSKNFQIIRNLLPNSRRIAHLVDPSAALAAIRPRFQGELDAASERLGFDVKGFSITDGEQLPAVFEQVAAFKADAFTQGGGPFWNLHRLKIIELIRAYRLPSLHIFRMDVVDGALMSYGSDMDGLFRTAASYIVRILEGAKPGDLPIEQATKLILAINMKTAREYGLDIPPVLLASADELIE